jgi:hypothetical protein
MCTRRPVENTPKTMEGTTPDTGKRDRLKKVLKQF